jgi:hypothetical protein
MSKETKTMAELLAERVSNGTADMEAAKHVAERTGHPALLKAFLERGYRVQKRQDQQSSPAELERQRRFGEAVQRLFDGTPDVPPPAPTCFEEHYAHRLFKRSMDGDLQALGEAVELVEGPSEWQIDPPE